MATVKQTNAANALAAQGRCCGKPAETGTNYQDVEVFIAHARNPNIYHQDPVNDQLRKGESFRSALGGCRDIVERQRVKPFKTSQQIRFADIAGGFPCA